MELCIEDEKAVDGTGPPIDLLGAGALQRKGGFFDTAQRGAQIGNHFLRSYDPDCAGGAASVAGKLASAARGDPEGAGLSKRGAAAHNDVWAGEQPPPLVGLA